MCRIRPFRWLRSLWWRILRAYHRSSMTEPTYNADKFAELLVYVVSSTEHEATSGDTKLNKLLYFADVTAFRRTGRPISGARYKHQKRGPIATPLIPVRRELKGSRLEVSERAFGNGAVQRRTRALSKADVSVFEDGEREIIDEVIERFRGCNAKAMEDFAHDEPAWRITEDEADMTYRSSLLVRQASPAALDHGKKLAERLGC
jgi:uncharacterized phage-associated protein